ncbi:hypothetical protein Tco_1522533 [Tanacetum coccineum]
MQRGRGGQRNNDMQKGKVINMVQCHSYDRKRKTMMIDKKGMNVPITFPLVLARDLSEEALVVEVDVEGYLMGWEEATLEPPAEIEPYDQGAIKNLQALSQRQPIGDTGQSKEKGILLRKNPSDSQGSGQMAKSRDSQACEVPHLYFKPSHVQESRRKLEDVHRLQKHQYRMSKRLLPATGDRHQDRVGHGFPTQVFSGYI